MKFSKLLSSLAVAAVLFGHAAPFATAANFTEPKVAKIYAKITLSTDKKVAKIKPLSADREKIAVAKANLEKAFLAVDSSLKKSEAERRAAVNGLVSAYANLNAVVRNAAANAAKGASSQPQQSSASAAASSASETPTSAAPSVSALSTPAQILYYANSFEGL